MPCRSDYMEPTPYERELGLVLSLLAELDGRPFDHRSSVTLGYANRVDDLDRRTAELCDRCYGADVSRYSLELQIWYRDHVAADQRRAELERIAAEREEAEARALYERLKRRFEP